MTEEKMFSVDRMRQQRVGAFGEKIVEAELLRRGWATANANASIKNAADFDIFAYKEKCFLTVRVKACGEGKDSFAFNVKPGMDIPGVGLGRRDFTILVAMGDERAKDVFYVVPTKIVRLRLRKHRSRYLATKNRDGSSRKDMGVWHLRLAAQRTNPRGSGFALKWKKYKERWEALET